MTMKIPLVSPLVVQATSIDEVKYLNSVHRNNIPIDYFHRFYRHEKNNATKFNIQRGHTVRFSKHQIS